MRLDIQAQGVGRHQLPRRVAAPSYEAAGAPLPRSLIASESVGCSRLLSQRRRSHTLPTPLAAPRAKIPHTRAGKRQHKSEEEQSKRLSMGARPTQRVHDHSCAFIFLFLQAVLEHVDAMLSPTIAVNLGVRLVSLAPARAAGMLHSSLALSIIARIRNGTQRRARERKKGEKVAHTDKAKQSVCQAMQQASRWPAYCCLPWTSASASCPLQSMEREEDASSKFTNLRCSSLSIVFVKAALCDFEDDRAMCARQASVCV